MHRDRYTSGTILDETAANLPASAVDQQLESIAEAIEYAADTARNPEPPAETEFARLLHRKLAG